jgi:glutathione S-transferase
MITLHHLNNSRSQRVIWLLEELKLPYQIRRYQRDPGTVLAPPELKVVHPLGKSPVITDGEITVAESGAIIEYLVETHGGESLRPLPGTAARRDYTYWLHYAEGSAMPLLVMSLVFSRLALPPMPWLLRPLASLIAKGVQQKFLNPQLVVHLDYIEKHLAKTGWFAGDAFSAADIQMSFVLEAASSRIADARGLPNIADFLKRIHARPAYQNGLAKGGPYAYA